MTRDYQADPLTGRPVSWRIAALDEPEPVRHGDAERRRPFAPVAPGCAPCSRSFRLRWGFAWTTRTGSDTKSPKWRINSLTRIRCRTQTSAGRHGMPATHTAVSYSNTTRRWYHPPADEGRFWTLVVWNLFMATHNVNDGRSSVNGHSAIPNADGSIT